MISFIEVAGSVLLFALVFGMSATVDIRALFAQLKNKKAIFTGCFLQFIILPLLGFIVVKALAMNETMGVSLLYCVPLLLISKVNGFENTVAINSLKTPSISSHHSPRFPIHVY